MDNANFACWMVEHKDLLFFTMRKKFVQPILREDFEDIISNLCVEALTGKCNYDDAASKMSTFAYGCLFNRIVDHFRRKKLPTVLWDAWEDDRKEELAGEYEEENFDYAGILDRLSKCKMTANEAVVFSMLRKGAVYETIAEETGMPLNTVKGCARRIKNKLNSFYHGQKGHTVGST